MLPRRVRAVVAATSTVFTAVTVYLTLVLVVPTRLV